MDPSLDGLTPNTFLIDNIPSTDWLGTMSGAILMGSLRFVAVVYVALLTTGVRNISSAQNAPEELLPEVAVEEGSATPVPRARETVPRRRIGKIGSAGEIDDATWRAMQGKSWHPGLGCPERSQLALLKIPYIDFFGKDQLGEMVVAKSVSVEVLQIFAELNRNRFPVASMRLIDAFGGRDLASMTANNTSAFNCRATTGGSRLSEHSFGTAIDINPIQNPYVAGLRILPVAGQQFGSPKARLDAKQGLLLEGDSTVKVFAAKGWKWGGSWSSIKDYQHFSKSGR